MIVEITSFKVLPDGTIEVKGEQRIENNNEDNKAPKKKATNSRKKPKSA